MTRVPVNPPVAPVPVVEAKLNGKRVSQKKVSLIISMFATHFVAKHIDIDINANCIVAHIDCEHIDENHIKGSNPMGPW